MNHRFLALAPALLLLAACEDALDLSIFGTDTSLDVFGDITGDTAGDTAGDAQPDGEVSPDVTPDAPEEVIPDAREDVETNEEVADVEEDTFVPECDEDDPCPNRFVCEDGVCVREAGPSGEYIYVAILSEAVDSSAFEGVNPGPDIDAIYLQTDSGTEFPREVVSYLDGPIGDADSNERTNIAAIFDEDVRRPVTNQCILDDPEEADYYSMGGVGGFVVVRFSTELDGSIPINIVELDAEYCSGNDGFAVRAEPFSVYVTDDGAAAARVTDDGEIRNDWCLVGASGGNGGWTILSIDAARDCAF